MEVLSACREACQLRVGLGDTDQESLALGIGHLVRYRERLLDAGSPVPGLWSRCPMIASKAIRVDLRCLAERRRAP